jgi:hypothetical protein
LPAVSQADYAEAAGSQADGGTIEEAVFIRAAVDYGFRHSRQDSGWYRATAAQIDQTCDSTH